MTETNADRNERIRKVIQDIVNESDERLFTELDKLHKRDIHDNDVNDALVALGLQDIADGYVDWMHDGEPVRADEDGPLDQGEELVTDPGDAASYKEMGTVSSLSAELAAAGINADNLEQGILDAYSARRIDHGIFYAEMSNDDVHWHVYKKRSHEDNGAYIATANDRAGAEFILHSLGTGTVEAM